MIKNTPINHNWGVFGCTRHGRGSLTHKSYKLVTDDGTRIVMRIPGKRGLLNILTAMRKNTTLP